MNSHHHRRRRRPRRRRSTSIDRRQRRCPHAAAGTRKRCPHAPHVHTPSGAFIGACTVIVHVGHTHATTCNASRSSFASHRRPIDAASPPPSSSSFASVAPDAPPCVSFVDGTRKMCKHRAHMHSACAPAGLISTAVLRETREPNVSHRPSSSIIHHPLSSSSIIVVDDRRRRRARTTRDT